jgi:hypothetical protein
MGIVAKVSTIMSSENRENLGTFATGTFRHIRDTHSRHTFATPPLHRHVWYRQNVFIQAFIFVLPTPGSAAGPGQAGLLAWTRMLACMDKDACLHGKQACLHAKQACIAKTSLYRRSEGKFRRSAASAPECSGARVPRVAAGKPCLCTFLVSRSLLASRSAAAARFLTRGCMLTIPGSSGKPSKEAWVCRRCRRGLCRVPRVNIIEQRSSRRSGLGFRVEHYHQKI